MQESSAAVSAGSIHAVQEPSLWIHSGAGSHHTPGGRGVQTGEKTKKQSQKKIYLDERNNANLRCFKIFSC